MSKSFERTIRREWKEAGMTMRVRHTAALFKLEAAVARAMHFNRG